MEEKEVRLYKYMANRLFTFLENLVLGLGCEESRGKKAGQGEKKIGKIAVVK